MFRYVCMALSPTPNTPHRERDTLAQTTRDEDKGKYYLDMFEQLLSMDDDADVDDEAAVADQLKSVVQVLARRMCVG